MSRRTDDRINVFLSSRLPSRREDALWKLRERVLDYAASLGLSVWRPLPKPPHTPAEEILDECLHYLSQADLYLCILEDTYGTHQEGLGDLSILELEIFHAVLSRKTPHFFAIEPFHPSAQLRTLLDALEVIQPRLIQRCSREEAFSQIKKILRRHRGLGLSRRLPPCMGFPARFAPFSRRRWAGRQNRDDLDLAGMFLQSRFAPFAFEMSPDKATINRLLEKAVATSHQPTRLVLLWAAIRHLGMARYDDPNSASFLPLWNRVLSLWAGATAWAGLHGQYLSLGRLPAVNTLLGLREHAATSHVTLRGQLNGSLASEYYSLAKRVRSRRRRRELREAALEQIQLGLATQPDDPSGLLLIQGSLRLALGRVDEAVAAYEAGLAHREKAGASPGALGEAQAELGFGYLRQGRMSEARGHLEAGVALLKQSKKHPGFTVRAMKKLALYYLRTWQLRRALRQLDEACELALAHGIHGQLTKLMLMSRWSRKRFFHKGRDD